MSVGACSANPADRPTPANRERITPAEIEVSSLRTAYDLVQQLRPNWLTERGRDSFRSTNPVVVYRDGARVGGVSQLRDIDRASIQEIRHLDAMSATQLYGSGHRAGAILVTSLPGS